MSEQEVAKVVMLVCVDCLDIINPQDAVEIEPNLYVCAVCAPGRRVHVDIVA